MGLTAVTEGSSQSLHKRTSKKNPPKISGEEKKSFSPPAVSNVALSTVKGESHTEHSEPRQNTIIVGSKNSPNSVRQKSLVGIDSLSTRIAAFQTNSPMKKDDGL